MIILLIPISFLIFLIHRRIKNRRFNLLLSKIPSPEKSSIPFLGHLNLIVSEINRLPLGSKPGEAFFLFEQKLAKEYRRHGVVAINYGMKFGTWIYIFTADAYRIILTCQENIQKSDIYFLLTDFMGTSNLLLSYAQLWKDGRKLITPAFHYSILDEFMTVFNDNATEFCSTVIEKKNIDDLYSLVSHFLMKSFIVTSLGLNVTIENEHIVDEYLSHFKMYNSCISERLTNPLYAYDLIFNMTSLSKKRSKALEYLHNFSMQAISQRMAYLSNVESGVEKRKRCCLADTLITAHMDNSNLYTLDYVQKHLDSFSFAGHDTTSNTLTNTLFLLAIHKDVQRKIQNEISENLTSDDIASISRDSIAKLQYLDAVVKESQRLFPAVSLIGRKITEEITIAGYTVPVGCNIIMSLFALHRDPEQFSNPDQFNPDRFLPDNEENLRRHPFAFLPFSAGLRNCLGQKYAIIQLKIFLIKILFMYEVDTKVKMEDIRFNQGVTLNISNKLDMTFKLKNHNCW